MFARLKNKIDPNLLRLWQYVKPFKGLLIGSAIFMGLSGAMSGLIATLLGKLMEVGFYDKETWALIAAPLALIVVTIFYGLFGFLSSYLLAKVTQNALIRLRTELFRNMTKWPAQHYQNLTSGQIAARFINEANNALTSAGRSCILIVKDGLSIVCLLFVLIYYNWQLTLVTFAVAPLIVWTLRTISRKMKSVIAGNQKSIAVLLATVQDAYKANRLIKVYHNYETESNNFGVINRTIRDQQMRILKLTSLGTPATQLITILAVALVVGVALWESQQGWITIGDFITFLTAMLLLMDPLRHIAGLNSTFVTMSVAAKGIFASIDKPLEEDKGTLELEKATGRMTFENVSLKYPGSKKFAVSDFNLEVNPGEHIALVGESGSGKSSIINMIPRFWLPTKGRILIDGHDYKDVTLTSLRDNIAIVTQDVFLFDDTIRNNIAYGMPNATEEEIQAAVKAAALEPFIESLPHGLESQVGEAGDKLSGGQKQRISIARAILKNAPILILDEATSALDSESERHIQTALDNLMQGRTCFTVAHRLSTIENADRIIVMENSKIIEMGTHQSLIEKDGKYANLVRLQAPKALEE
ncbi:MAG: lipid A export permease/ATP-binding protein MsbA [Burkholderiaceae bacterium]|nr:lipid A export permease/ATP-binding protein MsbA [Burkholderiaceae bacterium]